MTIIMNDNSKQHQESLIFHPANIFLGFLLAFLIGVTIVLLGFENFDICIVAGLLGLTIMKFFEMGNKKLLLFFFLLIGLFLGGWRARVVLQNSQHWLEGHYKGIGTVARFSESKEEYQRVYLKIKNLKQNKKGELVVKQERIIFFAPLGVEYKYGEKYQLDCELTTPENKYPKFNYRRFLAGKKVYQICHHPKIKKIDKTSDEVTDSLLIKIVVFLRNKKNGIYRIIHKFSLFTEQRINRFFPMPESGYLAGLLLGGDNRLPREVAESFRRTGTTHTVAVSGSNITILATALMFVGINLMGLWRKQAFYLVIAGIVVFIIMIGAPSSAVRAAIMGVILLYANQIGRLASSLRIIVLTAVIMVWQSPFILLYDAGFQLSFLATIGIILIYGPLSEKLKITNDFLGIKSIILVTLSAQLGVLGVLLYTFNSLSLMSLLANVLILPFISAIMLGGILTVIASFFGNIFGVILSLPTEALLHFEIISIDYLGKIPYAIIEFDDVSIWIAIGYYILFGLGIWLWKRREIESSKIN